MLQKGLFAIATKANDIIVKHQQKHQLSKPSNTPQYATKNPSSRQSAPKLNKRLASCLHLNRLLQAVVAVSPLADCTSCTASSFGFLESLAPSVC
jgi:hypothetical protein